MSTSTILISRTPRYFEFIADVDIESQEGLETVTLFLSMASAQPVILQDTLTVNIEDTTGECQLYDKYNKTVYVAFLLCVCTYISCSSTSILYNLCVAMIVEITEADVQVREGSGNNRIPVRVSFSTALKHPIDLEFIPLTYDQFFAMGLELPPEFPSRDVEASSMLVYVD